MTRQPKDPTTKATPTAATEVKIEYWPLSSLKPAKRNPKRHDIDGIKASFRRFGCTKGVAIVNEANGHMVVGHGSREALLEMKEAREPAPARIRAEGAEWFVPVVRGVQFTSEREAEAYLIADNKLTEAGGYNERLLGTMLQGMTIDGLGIKPLEAQSLIDLGRIMTHQPQSLEAFSLEPRPKPAWILIETTSDRLPQLEAVLRKLQAGDDETRIEVGNV
jgi:hypothetical protein